MTVYLICKKALNEIRTINIHVLGQLRFRGFGRPGNHKLLYVSKDTSRVQLLLDGGPTVQPFEEYVDD